MYNHAPTAAFRSEGHRQHLDGLHSALPDPVRVRRDGWMVVQLYGDAYEADRR